MYALTGLLKVALSKSNGLSATDHFILLQHMEGRIQNVKAAAAGINKRAGINATAIYDILNDVARSGAVGAGTGALTGLAGGAIAGDPLGESALRGAGYGALGGALGGAAGGLANRHLGSGVKHLGAGEEGPMSRPVKAAPPNAILQHLGLLQSQATGAAAGGGAGGALATLMRGRDEDKAASVNKRAFDMNALYNVLNDVARTGAVGAGAGALTGLAGGAIAGDPLGESVLRGAGYGGLGGVAGGLANGHLGIGQAKPRSRILGVGEEGPVHRIEPAAPPHAIFQHLGLRQSQATGAAVGGAAGGAASTLARDRSNDPKKEEPKEEHKKDNKKGK